MAVDKTELHDAVEYAAECLPDGWQITIEIERDSGSVYLFDEWGDVHDYPYSSEGLASDVRDAVEYAQSMEALCDDE